MNTPSAWFRATTLHERLATLRTHGKTSAADPALAAGRLQRWRGQFPFAEGSSFAQRLAKDGLEEADLLHLLGEPAEAVAGRAPETPAWLAQIERVYGSREDWEAVDLPESWRAVENIRFMDVVAPLLAEARRHMGERVQALVDAQPVCPITAPAMEEIFVGAVLPQLRRMLTRTLVLEFNIARMSGLLTGATPEERYQCFLERLRQRPSAQAFFEEYPVLMRQVLLYLQRWQRFLLEFLEHLCADWATIQAMAPDGTPGPLVGLQVGAGDTHRGGRSVLIPRFQSGFRIVYKPRSLAVDLHFQELLAWINDRGAAPSFRTVQIVERGDHAWMEFVETHGCHSEEEVRRFYERQGGYLALLYVLEATDFHSENLIAAGEHPVLLDLEALFHPRPPAGDVDVVDPLEESVQRIGLLPRMSWSNKESGGVDVSGLGATAGQLTPYAVPQLEGVGTDAMRLVRKRVEMLPDNNRPTLGGAAVSLLDYTAEILQGFRSVYRLLLESRDALLADNGPLARFADDEVRVIIRQTATYSTLLYESFHPDVLRDALDRDRLFDRLWAGIDQCPYLGQVIPAEQADLNEGDIPLFATRPASRDLWSSKGVCQRDFFTAAGLELVRRRLEQLSTQDLAQQEWIIRASLATAGPSLRPTSFTVAEPAAPANRERLLAAAGAVGDRLEELARRDRGAASWAGLQLAGDHWTVAPLGSDLYNGVPGVALFLAHLGHVTGVERYTALAKAATETVLRQAQRIAGLGRELGGFEGWGGVLYTLAHLGALWNRPKLLEEAEKIVGTLPPLIEQDEALDIIGGAAGCLGGLLSLYAAAPTRATLDAALRCGTHLVARALPMKQGVAWAPHVPARAPLAGFSHGAAGIAWALLELGACSGQERFRDTAAAALAYERSLFSPAAGNWPDLRRADDQPTTADQPASFFLSWCHGAPGIGLSRLHARAHLDDPALAGEIDVALRSTLTGGFGRNHCLCHGDLGNLELLLQAGRVLPDHRWRREADRLGGNVLASIQQDGWLCPAPGGMDSPGLMTGLSGIGYGLLRLACPERIPSVLCLEQPLAW